VNILSECFTHSELNVYFFLASLPLHCITAMLRHASGSKYDMSSSLSPFQLAFIKSWQSSTLKCIWNHSHFFTAAQGISFVLIHKESTVALSSFSFSQESYYNYLFKKVDLMIMCLLSKIPLMALYQSYNEVKSHVTFWNHFGDSATLIFLIVLISCHSPAHLRVLTFNSFYLWYFNSQALLSNSFLPSYHQFFLRVSALM
jgi:hypothetical protein